MRIFLRLRPIIQPYIWQVSAVIFFTLLLSGLLLIVPIIIRSIIDVGLTLGEVRYIVIMALALLGIGILRAGLVYSQRYSSEWIAHHIGYDLRNLLYDHIQNLPFSFHDYSQTGQLISRCIEDVRSIERLIGFGVAEFIRLAFLMVGIITLLFYQSSRLAIIALLPLIPLLLVTTAFGRKVGGFFYRVDIALGDLSTLVQENVIGVQVIRAFSREEYEIKRFSVKNQELYDARIQVASNFAWVMPSTHFLVALGTILILWFGGNMVLEGDMTVGDVVAFISFLLLLTQPAQQLAWLVNMAGEGMAGTRRSFEILDLKPTITSPIRAVELPVVEGLVRFDNVSLHYSNQIVPALEDINLVVEPNQVVALIGPTGSGKTSLVNLIPRFYDPSEGVVSLDGWDVRKVDLTSLRKQIGIVLQTSLLFSTSVSENIAYGRPDADMGQIESAATAAQAHEFILNLPNGYKTIIGERGVTLSGGQRQRIAIARALLMDPRILILDDSTSSVDIETEQSIQSALQRLMQGRTTFVIAHRLSTVKRADLILVMSDGQIVQRGKHEELLRMDGLYREIYRLQFSKQELQTGLDIEKITP